MKQSIPKAALAASLALGLGGATAEVREAHSSDLKMTLDAQVDPALYAEGQNAFNDVKNFWALRPNTLAVGEISLTYLQSDQSETCQNGARAHIMQASNPDAIAYCASSKTVYVSEAGIHVLKMLGNTVDLAPETTLRFTMAHELGHGVEYALGHASIGGLGTDAAVIDVQQKELRADCRAGEALAVTDKALIAEAPAFYDAISSPLDYIHGPAQRRIAAFNYGAQGNPCEGVGYLFILQHLSEGVGDQMLLSNLVDSQ